MKKSAALCATFVGIIASLVAVASPASAAEQSVSYAGCGTYVLYGSTSVGGWGWVHVPSYKSTALTDCVSSYGDGGLGVQALQHALNACYGKGLAEDGDYGPATENAVAAVQSWHGVGADGVFGPVTRNAMLWPTGENGCQSVSWIASHYYLAWD